MYLWFQQNDLVPRSFRDGLRVVRASPAHRMSFPEVIWTRRPALPCLLTRLCLYYGSDLRVCRHTAQTLKVVDSFRFQALQPTHTIITKLVFV
ncbi:hypothetical protein BDM02DRAFT_3116687 [Thelephora ganbajun]|uniref:Uncharacterized protein n=1 Tax=Thelephora ganbajun TaxID=370292 RepID=A0ACB6ZDQ9_THEGA|nr:hypothetical protein BDM02DRAFT_3116687 [Thelephora ganbajun]